MLYPSNFEKKIGFDKIRELVKGQCISDMGKTKVDEMHFSSSYDLILSLSLLTEEFKEICLTEDEFPISYFIDVRSYLKKIRIEGTYLTAVEAFDLKRSLDSIKAIVRFFTKRKEGEYPNLRKLTSEVMLYPFVVERIDAVLNSHGKIKDNASPELKNIRRSLIERENEISNRMHKIMKDAQKSGWVDSDTTLSVRDGRMLIPIPTSYKRKIKGLVYDESATGKTSYIEPNEIVEANNRIKELEFAERREIIKVLINLSNDIRPYVEELSYAYDFMAEIDFIRAKALFAININAFKPKVISDKSELSWERAVHPLLYLSHKKENRSIVPLSLNINSKDRIVLISGPNAGGKSVCLKTVGLLQYMFQCGLLVSVSDGSEMGIFNKIFIDIGDEQSIENDLSTYSSHLTNMKHFVENVDERTLILIDEFGTGTEPTLGAAIAEAILEKLNSKNVNGVITTHYTSLKHFATSVDGITNGAMLFDTDKLQPLFKLEIGKPGSSFAFEIAGKIGLPKEILDYAGEKIGQEHIDFEQHLKDIEQDRRELANLKRSLKQKEERLDRTFEKYDNEVNKTLANRQKILEQSTRESENLISSINKRVEKTIHEIRKTQAEKSKTKEVREKLEDFKEEISKKQELKEKQIEDKIEKIKQKQNKLKVKKEVKEPEAKQIDKNEIVDKKIIKGNKVKIKGQSTVGTVLELNGNNAVVSFGQMKTTINKNKLKKISNNEAKRLEKPIYDIIDISDNVREKKLNFTHTVDVRGKRGEEALRFIMDYIDEAIIVDATEVRILHGTGTGILKVLIREYLKTVDLVKSFSDERIQMGGAGITVVQFE